MLKNTAGNGYPDGYEDQAAVLAYLIARGHKMTERDVAQAQAQDQAFRAYVQDAAHGTSTADELAKLADLRDRGVISEADFQQGKDKILRAAA